MSNQTTRQIIDDIVSELDIPESAYDKAEKRYEDLFDWFKRDESQCSDFSPHVYSQGSFRLGTVVRPLSDDESYDLDLGCRLRVGVTKSTHTQKQLKELVGGDLEAYRNANQIKNRLEEKHRCWRLEYADELNFHMDTVPSIPEDASRQQVIREAMVAAGSDGVLAATVAKHTGAITDNRHPDYRTISPKWRISNSEGFALWFEARMRLARVLLENRALAAKVARIDELPAWKWKSPLQRVVQILKRHRDTMFADSGDNKPISVILTTLAARAYQGEAEIEEALARVLSDMGNQVSKTRPRVPNPVNPAEDFADKWYDPKYAHLKLEENFWLWLKQAQRDFKIVREGREPNELVEHTKQSFGVTLNSEKVRSYLGASATFVSTKAKVQEISSAPAKPWGSF